MSEVAPDMRLHGRTFYTNLLKEKYATIKAILFKALQNATNVATSADCWTSRRKSHIGVTVHLFDHQLKRISACLAIRRIVGSHSYDVLAKVLKSIHVQYQIVNKLTVTKTDNGSNFLKAFREFGPILEDNGHEKDTSKEPKKKKIKMKNR